MFALTVAALLLVAVGMLQAREARSPTLRPRPLAVDAKAALAILLALPTPAATLDSLFWTVFGAVLLTNRPLRWWLLRLP